MGKVEGGWGEKRIAQESPQSHGHTELFYHSLQVHIFPLFLSLSMLATLDTARLVVQYIHVAVLAQGWEGRAYEPLHHPSL